MSSSVSFNQLVYVLVRQIPPGKVLNYGRVAQLLGVPHGARAVGWAMSALKSGDQGVPWYRVVNAQGRVSIKGSPAGAAEQRARLEAEGITFDERGYLDMKQHLWRPALPEVEAIIRQARGDLESPESDVDTD
ncbi:MAG: MGMT family protein [Anaerolineae bacterium]|nr:MGMT family protein [Anaerolineae bacterium]